MRYFFMRYPGGKTRALTFSYDDGVVQDKRLAELFDKYNLKATFNFNNVESRAFNYSNEEIQEIFLSKGHEIAVHGANHRASGNLRTIEGIKDVLDCRLQLEERCGRIIRGMAYPDCGINQFGNFTTYPEIKAYLTELDIAYSRTLGADNDKFLLPNDFHAWVPSAHHNNVNLMEYIDKFLGLDINGGYIAHGFPRLLYIWGHSYEFDRDENWERMDEICSKLSNNPDIWYATNIEIYDYVKAYKSLVYSADSNTIYNPTLYEIFFVSDRVLYSIKSGETLKLSK